MNKYELMVIIQQGITEEEVEKTIEKVHTLLATNEATIESVEKIGTRKFAYPINYKNEGYYVLFNLTAPGATPNKVEKILNITDNIVRSMFVRK